MWNGNNIIVVRLQSPGQYNERCKKMASNYPSEPKKAGSVSNPATPGSGPGGTVPDIPLPSLSSTPDSGEPGRQTPSGGRGTGSHRRLAQGTLLSGDRYKIDK